MRLVYPWLVHLEMAYLNMVYPGLDHLLLVHLEQVYWELVYLKLELGTSMRKIYIYRYVFSIYIC